MPLARVSGKLFDALVDHEDGVPLLPVCQEASISVERLPGIGSDTNSEKGSGGRIMSVPYGTLGSSDCAGRLHACSIPNRMCS